VAHSLKSTKAMGVKQIEDLAAFRFAVAFKLEVYDLVRRSPKANQDFRYKNQLFAASGEMNVTEGWGRGESTAEMMVFLRYARASIHEARRHVLDGVSRGYFAPSECEKALLLANRSAGTITNLWKSLKPFREAHRKTPPSRPPKLLNT
jgi:four helix bundle protein